MTSVYRTRSQVVTSRVVALGLSAYAIVKAVAVANAGNAWPLTPLIASVAGIFVLAVLIIGRAGVWVEDGGVRIVNISRTVRVPWNEIERFSTGPFGVLPKVGIVELRSGDRIGLTGIQAPNPITRPKNRDADEMIEALNKILEENRDRSWMSNSSQAEALVTSGRTT